MNMTSHIGRVATIVISVNDQARALRFYVDILGMEKVNDFEYPSGERWLEVSPAEGSANICLVTARPERPAGAETGVVLFSADIDAGLDALRNQDAAVDVRVLKEGEIIWWSGAPLRRGAEAVPVTRSRR